jgi:phosphatidylglycerol:prolipoprotein diacylglycerol transferase
MYPNLRFAIYDITGMDIPMLGLVQSYGLFLALAFLSSGIALAADLKRREKLGLLKGTTTQIKVGEPISWPKLAVRTLISFIVLSKAIYALIHPEIYMGPKAKEALLSLDTAYWLAGLMGSFLLSFLHYKNQKKELAEYPNPTTITKLIMPHERVGDIVIIAAVSGLIGAKLLYMTEVEYTSWEQMMADLFSGSGLAVYGGFILAFFVVVLYIRKHNIPLSQMLDACAPAMIIAYGVGRLGCHFSGDGDWGDPNPIAKPFSFLPDWMWSYNYPNNVLGEGILMQDCGYPSSFGNYCYMLENGVYPTPVFEFIMASLIFLFLWRIRHKIKTTGLLFFIYLMFNGIERFIIEIIRINKDYQVFGIEMSQAQFISIIIFTIGLLGSILFLRTQINNEKWGVDLSKIKNQ